MSREQLKKWIIIVIVFVIMVFTGLFVTKNIASNKPAEQQTTTEPQTTESNEDTTEESATPLTENEIKELYLNAHKLYSEWFSPANNLVVDWDNITKINDKEYFLVNSTEITTVEELKTEFKKYFDNEIIANTIDKYYVMHNGKMYGDAVLVEGGDAPWERYELTVKTNTDTGCTFTITSYIGDSKQDLDYKLKVIDGEWKFTDVFHWVSTNE